MFDDRLLKILDGEVAKEKYKRKKKATLELRKEKRLTYYSGWHKNDEPVTQETKEEKQIKITIKMEKEELIKKVEEKINSLLKEFEDYPDSFNYEGDMVCKLYCYLAEINELVIKDEYNKEQLLHSQVATLSNKRQKFDIAILDSSNTEDDTSFIAIECKFNENKFKKIKDDFSKLKKPENKVPNAYFIIFETEKMNNFDKEEFEAIKNDTKVKVFYKFKELLNKD